MIGFIDDHRDRFGVEPICRVLSEHNLQVAPSGYYALKSRKPSKRSLSDAAVWERIEALQADKTKGNGVAGYRKMWHLLKREGVVAPRCQVARLMRTHGMQGLVSNGPRLRARIVMGEDSALGCGWVLGGESGCSSRIPPLALWCL